ncbi:MAG: adenine deaminase, partial [Phycisphaerales bacterium]|nr:adenine deaminase [Phycisphaerales bacterium]
MISRTDPELMGVARGDHAADLVFINGQVVNVFTRSIERVSVSVFGGRIAGVGVGPIKARQTIDLDGRYLAPGLIDAHMHVESTMMMPREFVRVAAPHGTTGVVFDPHEIANVLGMPGIRLLMDASVGLPMNIMFAASSCVPSSDFENSGARLEASDLAPLFDDPRVVALAEMMNFPGVFLGDESVLERVRLGLERAVVDGHCPGLSGAPLGAYVASGVSSDHECTTPEEALEKIGLGLRVFLREGSAARNIEALVGVVNAQNA